MTAPGPVPAIPAAASSSSVCRTTLKPSLGSNFDVPVDMIPPSGRAYMRAGPDEPGAGVAGADNAVHLIVPSSTSIAASTSSSSTSPTSLDPDACDASSLSLSPASSSSAGPLGEKALSSLLSFLRLPELGWTKYRWGREGDLSIRRRLEEDSTMTSGSDSDSESPEEGMEGDEGVGVGCLLGRWLPLSITFELSPFRAVGAVIAGKDAAAAAAASLAALRAARADILLIYTVHLPPAKNTREWTEEVEVSMTWRAHAAYHIAGWLGAAPSPRRDHVTCPWHRHPPR